MAEQRWKLVCDCPARIAGAEPESLLQRAVVDLENHSINLVGQPLSLAQQTLMKTERLFDVATKLFPVLRPPRRFAMQERVRYSASFWTAAALCTLHAFAVALTGQAPVGA